MGDCATQQTMRFETGAALALEVAFDGGMLTSDGGLPLLAEIDAELGVCESLAECVPEWRTGPSRHSLLDLVRQRVFQTACGYEDQNDANLLRSDPLLKLACGRLPEDSGEFAHLVMELLTQCEPCSEAGQYPPPPATAGFIVSVGHAPYLPLSVDTFFTVCL